MRSDFYQFCGDMFICPGVNVSRDVSMSNGRRISPILTGSVCVCGNPFIQTMERWLALDKILGLYHKLNHDISLLCLYETIQPI